MTDERTLTADELLRYGVRVGHACAQGWYIYKPATLDHWTGSMWTRYGDSKAAFYPSELAAREAATAIVRAEREPKVERLTFPSWQPLLAEPLRAANLYRLTDPDGSVRVVQRWPEELVWHSEMTDGAKHGDVLMNKWLADQRRIREVADADKHA